MLNWKDALLKKYDFIFEDCYELNPPDGWEVIVQTLVEYIHWHNHLHGSKIQIWNITERNGGLKVQLTDNPRFIDVPEEIHGAVYFAEKLSCRTCKFCGSNGEFLKIKNKENKLIMATVCKEHKECLNN